MIHNRTIRSLLAAIALALFALSVTPRLVIHALVAHHTDSHLSLDHDKTDQLNKAGFHCAIDNLVVESPFLDYTVSVDFGILPLFPAHQPASLEEPLSFSHFIFGLRGPPAAALA